VGSGVQDPQACAPAAGASIAIVVIAAVSLGLMLVMVALLWAVWIDARKDRAGRSIAGHRLLNAGLRSI
jgi:hypothetical protein